MPTERRFQSTLISNFRLTWIAFSKVSVQEYSFRILILFKLSVVVFKRSSWHSMYLFYNLALILVSAMFITKVIKKIAIPAKKA